MSGFDIGTRRDSAVEGERDLKIIDGPQRGSLFAIDNELLLIWFDDQGRTLRYEIRSD